MKRCLRMFLRVFYCIPFLAVTCEAGYSQSLRQTIKGIIKDMDSQLTLPGATVVIMESNPVIGTVTNAEGEFRIDNISVGRYTIKVTFIGYEPAIISEVQVQSGKETVLQISLKESSTTLQEVKVKAYRNKEQAVNPMAMISARQLTMEEASRYAGGIDDPARLATAFAGVAGSLSSNAIVIRGNAPKGLLWRMEGIEIPNPSHFANVSTFGGGGITALSSQMLGNSDFYTAAFPAEYGNALSGVFDMRIRTGNNEKHEQTFKAGLTGLDFALEGPFSKAHRSSYLINYRYSTLALISPLLPENAQGLKYQDLSFKVNFPVGKSGTISAWGLLSSDFTGSKVKKDTTDREFYQDIEQDQNRNRMGAMGINHKISLSDNTWLNSAVAVTGNYIYWHRDRLDAESQLFPKDEISQNERKYALSFMVNHKFGPRHTNRTGFEINELAYRVQIKQNNPSEGGFKTYTDEHGNSELLQLYSQSRIDLSGNISANLGLHSQWFSLNSDFSLEPRVSLKWQYTEKQSFTMAYGIHSRLEPIGFYFARQNQSGQTVMPNKKLKLTRAEHIVLSWELSTGKNSRLKIEPFFQHLYDVPVIPNSSFSMLNLEADWFFNDSLVNKGKGNNMGIDLTLERFLHDGWYYLFTASLFDSKYTGGDHITRNTRFDKNYVINFLFGREWVTGLKKNNVLGLNGKFSILGGDRITPVNFAASEAARDVVYVDSRAFSNRKDNVYYLDFTASWQKNKPSHTSTWSVQFVNMLFQKEFYGYRYNFKTGQVEPQKEIVVIPNISYKIDF